MTVPYVSQETAQWALHVWSTGFDSYRTPKTGVGEPPPAGVRGLLVAAAHLEDRALARLDMAFPELVAAVELTKTTHGLEVLRAIAKNGVPT
jgi:hypothetical protein